VRILSWTLERVGLAIVCIAVVGGVGLALYALADAARKLSDGDLSGPLEAVARVVLYPIAAGAAGSLVATVGLVLMYLGDSLADESERESAPKPG
jgi:hypothetical protein